MLTLDEAIKHAEEKAKELEEQAQSLARRTKYSDIPDCLECAKEHEQLGKWLKELKELRAFTKFVTKEVLDDDFEDCSGAFAEIACRKLVKLGYVKLDGDTYKENKE